MKKNLFLIALLCVSVNAFCGEGTPSGDDITPAPQSTRMAFSNIFTKRNAKIVTTLGVLGAVAYRFEDLRLPAFVAATTFAASVSGYFKKNTTNPWIGAAVTGVLTFSGQRLYNSSFFKK